jgi:hypothetical protein
MDSQGYQFTFQAPADRENDSDIEFMDPPYGRAVYVPGDDVFSSTSFSSASSPRSTTREPPETEDESSDWSPPPSPTLKNTTSTLKRDFAERSTNTPHASPAKKRNRVEVASSTRMAFEISAENEVMGKRPQGLLQFFKKGSQADTSSYWAKQVEAGRGEREDEVFNAKVYAHQKKQDRTEAARVRKQKQREREKEAEISSGVRSPGGRKRKVS